jgi:hypothetical protein
MCDLLNPNIPFVPLWWYWNMSSNLCQQRALEGHCKASIWKPLPFLPFFFIIVLLFICAYKAWVIYPPCPQPPFLPLQCFFWMWKAQLQSMETC